MSKPLLYMCILILLDNPGVYAQAIKERSPGLRPPPSFSHASARTPALTTLTMPPGRLTGIPFRPIAPGYCPPGYLPQYCAQLTKTHPILAGTCGVNVPSYQCLQSGQIIQQQQQLAAMGCPPGPYQYSCVQKVYQRSQQRSILGPVPMGVVSNGIATPMPMKALGLSGQPPGGYANGYDREIASGDYDGPGGDGPSNSPYVSSDNLRAVSPTGHARIVEPFKRHFAQCTQSLGLGVCEFRNDGIWGDQAHQQRQSCHNAGEAIDVGLPFKCTTGGSVGENDPQAMEVAKCMASQAGNELQVIFRDAIEAPNMMRGSPRGAHNHHMHIQLKYCRMIRVRG